MNDIVKIVIFVPTSHSDIVRDALGNAGAGQIGNYSHCSFSTKGFGRFIPTIGANPKIGELNKLEQVEEERIETICSKEMLKSVIDAVKKVHPYEEVAIDIYSLEHLQDI